MTSFIYGFLAGIMLGSPSTINYGQEVGQCSELRSIYLQLRGEEPFDYEKMQSTALNEHNPLLARLMLELNVREIFVALERWNCIAFGH